MSNFLKMFSFGGLTRIGVGPIKEPLNFLVRYLDDDAIAKFEVPTDKDVFFAPAQCSTEGDTKGAVLGSTHTWVDADDPQKPLCTLPPSLMVKSGRGWHVYWKMAEPITDKEVLEGLNKRLADDVPTADKSTWNCNRLMRVPGSVNTKHDGSPRVEIALYNDKVFYTPPDFNILDSLDDATKHKIRTGDRRGYRSRSERDWAILVALVKAGASDRLIETIFMNQPCGDKAKENPEYFFHTLEKVHEEKGGAPEGGAPQTVGIIEGPDGFYVTYKRGQKRISTFLIEPTLLLDGSTFGAEDAIVGDVKAEGFDWKGVTFPRSAFTSTAKMDKVTPLAAWQWLGNDEELRRLLPYLLEKLKAKGLPKVTASPTMGLHFMKGQWLFLGDKQTLSKDMLWEGYDAPLVCLATGRERPNMELTPQLPGEDYYAIRDNLPLLNEPEVIWPMIGWYSSTMLKPWLESEDIGYRFPVLNVAGTKGSGKTTLIQRVFLQIFGQKQPKTYDAGTTRFVTLALLGSSNNVPIAFSEFRYETVAGFTRYILLSYDTGHDPRGRSDQTTVDYPLSAPMSVDGEDLISDPAARERLVVAHLRPDFIAEFTPAWVAWQELKRTRLDLSHFGGYYIQYVLSRMDEMKDLLAQAEKAIYETFPDKLPDRVRRNHIVAYFGILLWCGSVGIQPPPASVMGKSIQSIFDLKSGRARVLVDDLVEDIINAAGSGTATYKVSVEGDVFWFQLTPAHAWWLAARRRSGRGGLERDAIKAQLEEAPYSVTPSNRNGTWMYGINLVKAQECGLDIPNELNLHKFTINF